MVVFFFFIMSELFLNTMNVFYYPKQSLMFSSWKPVYTLDGFSCYYINYRICQLFFFYSIRKFYKVALL